MLSDYKLKLMRLRQQLIKLYRRYYHRRYFRKKLAKTAKLVNSKQKIFNINSSPYLIYCRRIVKYRYLFFRLQLDRNERFIKLLNLFEEEKFTNVFLFIVKRNKEYLLNYYLNKTFITSYYIKNT